MSGTGHSLYPSRRGSGRRTAREHADGVAAGVSARQPWMVKSTRGFTLLELLVATAVGAIVLLVIQTTYFGALRLHNTTHEKIDTDLALQRALAIVRRDFAGLMLPGGTLAGQLQTENFSSASKDSSGERIGPDIFTNSGRIDGWSPFSDVQMVSYSLAPATDDSSANVLMRVVTRNLLPVQEITAEETALLGGVAAASISFYDGTSWTDVWDSEVTRTLPKALKFSLTMASADPSVPALGPIELVVPVSVVTTTTLREEEEAAAPLP